MTLPTPPDAAGGIAARHQAALNQGQFLIQRCGGCQQHVYFPRELCPHCGSEALALVAPAGTGTVYSTTTVRRKPEAGGDLNVALIDLDEGVRLMSRVEGVPTSDVRIGQRVKARVLQREGAAAIVVFDLVNEGVAA
ncbi:Zn-ribbon domain-containing OB-fold protein [Pseudorhodoferax sp. Leaf267]|uniref:Zn-ribbon domain-containing OB-fold protein n=1 Tax=Pseudorhodoferax sp. Leaf267 TaxID=1736316 RepID=UPI0009EC99A0|nr:OB-fold domain-containing protein [Pseudorhodoferax sp. Leaf267]